MWYSENFDGMRETQNSLTGLDLTATREGGFAIILARDAVLGKVFGTEMTELRDAGLW